MIKLKILLQSKYLYLIVLLLSLLYSFIKINVIKYKSYYSLSSHEVVGTLTKIVKKDNLYKLTIKGKEKVICTYITDKNPNIKLGSKIKVSGKFSLPNNNTVPNTFNYRKYLNNHHIFYLLNVDKIVILNTNNNLIYKIKNIIYSKIETHNKTKDYLKTFILGDKTDLEKINIYQSNGVSHLFAISGMHISLISFVLLFLFKKLKIKNIIVIVILIIYSQITEYSASIYRSILFYILFFFNNKLDLNISSKNLLLLTATILNLYDPLIIYDLSFEYSFIVTYGLLLSSKYYKKNYFYNLLITSIIAFLFSLPITLINNYEVNILSILNNLIVVPLVSFIIFPLSIISILFPFLDSIFLLFIRLLEFISHIQNTIALNIIIPKVSIIFYLSYYLILLLFIHSSNKKYLLLNLLLLLSLKTKPLLDNNTYVYFIDVKEGDSTFISYKNKTLLIDTGGVFNYHISDNSIKLIKSLGYSHLDYLILTHGDFDHMGDSQNIINNLSVKNVIFNKGKYNKLEKNLKQELIRKKIKYELIGKKINIGPNKINILDTNLYNNENDNSNVIYTKINNIKILLMGDASITKEQDLINKYKLNNIDFLKVGHHGSNTSSSKYFIDKIKPKHSVISVGKNNRYGFPKKDVVHILRKSKIYRTDTDGSIELIINNKGHRINNYSP